MTTATDHGIRKVRETANVTAHTPLFCPRCKKPAERLVTAGNSTVPVCEDCAADLALDDTFRTSSRRHAAIEYAGHNPRKFRTR